MTIHHMNEVEPDKEETLFFSWIGGEPLV